ncbi:hypothetical protein DFH09DRAFT_1236626 [Mycena vulgaris]|nr:hypothetical protein DFH09DRAFT_1236626 [Mycena vulgaris]
MTILRSSPEEGATAGGAAWGGLVQACATPGTVAARLGLHEDSSARAWDRLIRASHPSTGASPHTTDDRVSSARRGTATTLTTRERIASWSGRRAERASSMGLYTSPFSHRAYNPHRRHARPAAQRTTPLHRRFDARGVTLDSRGRRISQQPHGVARPCPWRLDGAEGPRRRRADATGPSLYRTLRIVRASWI